MKTIIEKISENKEVSNAINKISYYSPESFVKDCKRYIKAIKEGRMICNIKSVAPSGMSRNIKFLSCEKNDKRKNFWYSNYNCLFDVLGFTKARSNDFYFTIHGCGMDMIFDTNYRIIHNLYRLGFIGKKECDKLAQMTPSII